MSRKKACPLCQGSYVMLGRHLRRWHCIQNPEERAMLLNLVNGRVEVKREHCPVPTCAHASTRLDRHLLRHRDVSRWKMKEYMAQLKLTVTIRLLAKLRATNPWAPLRSDLDLVAPQSTPLVIKNLFLRNLLGKKSKKVVDDDADPPRPEEPCAEGIEGGLEDPQSPSVDPPEKHCAEAFCRWQAKALAKVVWELEQTRALLGKLRASQKSQALARKGDLYVGTLKRARSRATTSPKGQPKRVAVEAVCLSGLEDPQSPSIDPPEKPCPEAVCLLDREGGLEDPQSPSIDPPEEPCAEAFCRWQATALAKVVSELDQTRAFLGKLRALRKYQALARKGDLYVGTLKRARSRATTSPKGQPKRAAVEAPDPSSRTTNKRRFRHHIPSPNKLRADRPYNRPGGVHCKGKAKRRSAKPIMEEEESQSLSEDEVQIMGAGKAKGTPTRSRKPLPAVTPIKQLQLRLTRINTSHLRSSKKDGTQTLSRKPLQTITPIKQLQLRLTRINISHLKMDEKMVTSPVNFNLSGLNESSTTTRKSLRGNKETVQEGPP